MAPKKSNDSNRQTIDEAPLVELQSVLSRAEKREGTRSQIALYYVLGFLFIVLICFIVAGINKLDVSQTRDLLVTVSGILSGPLGFIIGYYFKSHSDKE